MADGERREARYPRHDEHVSSSYRVPDETAELERKRLQQLGALFDEPTISRLRRFGAQPGWNCLEVGAGSGSVRVPSCCWSRPTGMCWRPISTTGSTRATNTTSSSACTTSPVTRCRPTDSISRTRAGCSNTSATGTALVNDGHRDEAGWIRRHRGPGLGRVRRGRCSRIRSVRCTGRCGPCTWIPRATTRTSARNCRRFLLWQSAHSEFWFCEAYWPDFRRVDFLRALRDYAARRRRFGE